MEMNFYRTDERDLEVPFDEIILLFTHSRYDFRRKINRRYF